MGGFNGGIFHVEDIVLGGPPAAVIGVVSRRTLAITLFGALALLPKIDMAVKNGPFYDY